MTVKNFADLAPQVVGSSERGDLGTACFLLSRVLTLWKKQMSGACESESESDEWVIPSKINKKDKSDKIPLIIANTLPFFFSFCFFRIMMTS